MLYPSRFNVVYPWGSGSAVFSLMERKLFRFSVRWEEIVQAVGSDPEVDKRLEQAGLFLRSESYVDQIDEYFKRREAEDNQNLIVYFCVTTKCNIGCSYCFQDHTERRDSNLEVIDRFLHLLDQRLGSSPRIPAVHLILFGGEPIQRPDLCTKLIAASKEIGAKHNVKVATYLAANGVMETPAALRPLAEAGLDGIQVTFDGPEALHEKVRGKTYRGAVEMLPYYSDTFYLTLKYNLTRETATTDAINEFLDDLVAVNLRPGTIIMPEPVVPTVNYQHACEAFKRKDLELPDAFLRFGRAAAERSFGFSFSSAFHPPCFLRRRNVLEIQPDGNVLVCEVAHGIDRFYSGNLLTMNELTPPKPEIVNDMKTAAAGKCTEIDCPYFPLCESGCFFVKHINDIPFSDTDCQLDYFHRIFSLLPELFSVALSEDELGTTKGVLVGADEVVD